MRHLTEKVKHIYTYIHVGNITISQPTLMGMLSTQAGKATIIFVLNKMTTFKKSQICLLLHIMIHLTTLIS